MKCNWCIRSAGKSPEFDSAVGLRDHKRDVHGCDRPAMFRTHMDHITDEQVVTLIREGQSIRTTADILNVSYSNIQYKLAKMMVRQICKT